jgi:peptidoglycan hydrolase-like protein with peptidoglycan-binding domain
MGPGYGPMMVNAPPPSTCSDADRTRAAQVRLIGSGLLRGRAGGVMGPQTGRAISQFESGSALPVDSVPLPPLLARLQPMP